MRVAIDITADLITVRQYGEGGELLLEQRYRPTLGAGGSFGWNVPFDNPQAPGGKVSCMVFMIPDGGERAENLGY